MTMSEGDLAVAELAFVRDRADRAAAAAGGDDRRARLAARQSVVDAVQHRADDPDRPAARLGDPRARQVPVHRCGVDRRRPRRLPRSRAASRDRRLLAVRLGAACLFHLRLLSDPGALARRCVLRLLALGVVWLLWLEAPRRDLGAVYFFVVLPICSFVLLHGWRAIGLPVGRHRAVGRHAGDHRGRLGRHRAARCRSAFCWRSAGARTCRPSSCSRSIFIEFVRGVPLITVLFMASVMLPLFVPEQLVARQAAARAGRRRAVRLGLYGRGGARRPAGDPEGPVRGRHGGRPRLLADDAADHPAAGAEDHHPEHRQHLSSACSRTRRWCSSSAFSISCAPSKWRASIRNGRRR